MRTVHPRACGEQRATAVEETTGIGSSPRLRGTVLAALGQSEEGRFIPAPAGNSSLTSLGEYHPPVHPRACGEQASTTMKPSGVIGSSPRLRGTDTLSRGLGEAIRFIPAPAGNR